MRVASGVNQRFMGLLALLSLTGVGLSLVGTSRYGVGLSNDSARYISAAISLSAGYGFLQHNGEPIIDWPPLYPGTLAVFNLAGIEPLVATRYLNAVAFGLTIFASGVLFRRQLEFQALALIATVWVLFSMPLIHTSTMAWSEPVFIFLSLLFILLFPGFLKEGERSKLVLLSAVAALACLQRYVGAALVFTGVLSTVFWMSRVSLLSRLKIAALFGALSTLPVCIWMLRNYQLTGRLTGWRGPPQRSLQENFSDLLDAVQGWFEPVPLWTILVCLAAFFAILTAVQAKVSTQSRWTLQLRCAAVLVLVYSSVVLFFTSYTNISPIGNRLSSPLYVFAILFVFWGLDRGAAFFGRISGRPTTVKVLAIGFSTLWLAFPAMGSLGHVSSWARQGPWGYNSDRWQKSPLIKWLTTNSIDGRIYSNSPEAIYLLIGIRAEQSPRRIHGMERFMESLPTATDLYLVWFDDPWIMTELFTLKEISSFFRIEKIKKSRGDEGIYRLHRRASASNAD